MWVSSHQNKVVIVIQHCRKTKNTLVTAVVTKILTLRPFSKSIGSQ